jgi:pantoate--beta-alanine ligase
MSVAIYRSAAEFRSACDKVRAEGGTLGLVPTMGALHSGHAALMREANRLTSHVAVTIFVNPMQFGPNEDYSQYPRTLDQDRALCQAAGVNLLFVPETSEVYPPGDSTRVRVSGLTNAMCGAVRPNHFEGVTTIVTKLFVLAGTCTAVFGRKDYQQLKVIERLVQDLLLPVKIVGYPTLRETDGLAISSRNAYLSPIDRLRACAIVAGLSRAWRTFVVGERRAGHLLACVEQELSAQQLQPQYINLANADTLDLWNDASTLPDRALLAVAAFCGETRLIDNLVLGEDGDPLSNFKCPVGMTKP